MKVPDTWLDETKFANNTQQGSIDVGTWSGNTLYGQSYPPNYQPSYQYYWSNWHTCNCEIKLKWSEIEVLRRLVSENKEAKHILNKFRHMIEVEVDF